MLIDFTERGREGEGDREKHKCKREISIGAFHTCPNRNQTCNPGVCPDQELNLRPFSSRTTPKQATRARAAYLPSNCFVWCIHIQCYLCGCVYFRHFAFSGSHDCSAGTLHVLNNILPLWVRTPPTQGLLLLFACLFTVTGWIIVVRSFSPLRWRV